MSGNSKKSYFWKHCYRRIDWQFNRQSRGLSIGTADRNRLLCDKCKNRKICMGQSETMQKYFPRMAERC